MESGDLQKEVASEIIGLLMLEVRWETKAFLVLGRFGDGACNLLREGKLKRAKPSLHNSYL